MVTQQMGSPIEYDHTSTKIGGLTDCCVIMSAGAVTLIEDLIRRTKSKVTSNDMSIHEIAEKCSEAYLELINDYLQRHILSTYGFTYNIFSDNERVRDGFLSMLAQNLANFRQEIESNLISLIVGVDDNGGQIYAVRAGNFHSFNSIGYQTIGSGDTPAEFVFIHNGYDVTWDLKKAIVTLVEAKKQAEEAQGVGRETDIAIISKNGKRDLDRDDIQKLKELHDRIADGIKEIRKRVIEEGISNINL